MAENHLRDPSTWVDEHGTPLYRYALLRVQDAQVAEELVQETLLGALRARESFAGRSSVRTWLFGILKHKVIDHFRSVSRERSVADVELLGASSEEPFDERGAWTSRPSKWATNPVLLFEQREFWAVLQRCLNELPHRLHRAFTLRELDGLSTEEICNILQVTPTNIGVMLHRARMRLRTCLEANWFDPETGER